LKWKANLIKAAHSASHFHSHEEIQEIGIGVWGMGRIALRVYQKGEMGRWGDRETGKYKEVFGLHPLSSLTADS
jgi:hypothetical protein